jgi:hypothetical protein
MIPRMSVQCCENCDDEAAHQHERWHQPAVDTAHGSGSARGAVEFDPIADVGNETAPVAHRVIGDQLGNLGGDIAQFKHAADSLVLTLDDLLEQGRQLDRGRVNFADVAAIRMIDLDDELAGLLKAGKADVSLRGLIAGRNPACRRLPGEPWVSSMVGSGLGSAGCWKHLAGPTILWYHAYYGRSIRGTKEIEKKAWPSADGKRHVATHARAASRLG